MKYVALFTGQSFFEQKKDSPGLPVICQHNGLIEIYGIHTFDSTPLPSCGMGQNECSENGCFEVPASGIPRKIPILALLETCLIE